MIEVWSTIIEAPRYEVSTLGRVRRGDHYFRPWTHSKAGYLKVDLISADGRRIKRYVHRLVAIAFLPNPDNLPEVNHDDGNPSNCAIGNLEWVTFAGNKIHARDVLGAQHGAPPVPVIATCIETDKSAQFPSIRAASAALGVPTANIFKVLTGARAHAGKFTFIKERS